MHGDYNGVNICVGKSLKPIVIFDWQMTSVHGGKATYGSRYFDIIWFINYLIWTPTIRYLFVDPVTSVAKLFIESYFKESSVAYDVETATRYAKNFFDVKESFRKQDDSWKARYLFFRSQIITRAFIKLLHEI